MTSRRTRSLPTPRQRRRQAGALVERLVEPSTDPGAFAENLEDTLALLADRARRQALRASMRSALAGMPSSAALDVAARLEGSGSQGARRLALPFLEHALGAEPERAWQSLRRLGRALAGPEDADALARVWAQGVLAEPFRWAELEQLVYSPRPPERRLVAAAMASIPGRLPRAARQRLRAAVPRHVLPTLGLLVGDDSADVQQALSRALRAWTRVDEAAIEGFLRDQAAIAAEHRDGHRARVVRDALSAQPEAVGRDVRGRLAGIRRIARAPSTSRAAQLAATFAPGLADVPQPAQGERFARVRARA